MPDSDSPHPVIHPLVCKGCGRCVAACPNACLRLGSEVNVRGYKYAVYRGNGCVGCGSCFYMCPEPLALEVHRRGTDSARRDSEPAESAGQE